MRAWLSAVMLCALYGECSSVLSLLAVILKSFRLDLSDRPACQRKRGAEQSHDRTEDPQPRESAGGD